MTTRYVYDGWRLVAELNGNTVLRSYAWGKDLSGSLDGAGGVGGLVAQTDHTTEAVYFPAYDGNGNVTALVKCGPECFGVVWSDPCSFFPRRLSESSLLESFGCRDAN